MPVEGGGVYFYAHVPSEPLRLSALPRLNATLLADREVAYLVSIGAVSSSWRKPSAASRSMFESKRRRQMRRRQLRRRRVRQKCSGRR